MLLNWQGRHFMEINHSRITSYEIADYMIRTKSLLSAKELAAILEKEYPHLDVDKRDVYLRLKAIAVTDIREYLLEQGHLNYATVAAEARKEAHRMKATNVKSEKIHATSVQESELVVVQNQSDEIPVLEWLGVRVVTTETLAISQ